MGKTSLRAVADSETPRGLVSEVDFPSCGLWGTKKMFFSEVLKIVQAKPLNQE